MYISVVGIKSTMKKNVLTAIAIFVTLVSFSQTKLQSPAEFLGYELGDRFTRHHRMVEYFKHVDEAQANVQVMQYGETYEHRPLIYAIIASPARIEYFRVRLVGT